MFLVGQGQLAALADDHQPQPLVALPEGPVDGQREDAHPEADQHQDGQELVLARRVEVGSHRAGDERRDEEEAAHERDDQRAVAPDLEQFMDVDSGVHVFPPSVRKKPLQPWMARWRDTFQVFPKLNINLSKCKKLSRTQPRYYIKSQAFCQYTTSVAFVHRLC